MFKCSFKKQEDNIALLGEEKKIILSQLYFDSRAAQKSHCGTWQTVSQSTDLNVLHDTEKPD